ncbi:MAG: 30S ribosomal protein S5 [Patescibacteria group bacterium]
MPKETKQHNTDRARGGAAGARNARPPRGGGAGGQRRGGSQAGGRPRRANFERAKPEFDQKMIDIRRVTRVVSGGRRFNFSVAVVAGDRNGRVGVGTGKAGDTSLAIEKAFRSAKKNMIKLRLTKAMSIPHETEAKLASARVMLMPAPGRGIVAGSSVRIVLDLAGVKDIGAKIFSRSKNKLNNARATIKALEKLK